MSSPPSSSNETGPRKAETVSSAFDALNEGVQRWLWKQGWKRLRAIQEQAVAPIIEGQRDVILAAPTAGGKTEAAFLPIVTHLATAGEAQLCVCLSPLKALINDQYERLLDIGQSAGVGVRRWHGDVGQSHKNGFLRNPTGLLLITPESLEAHLVRRGMASSGLFGNLSHVVVDELHAFIGTDRGKQLQSLLHRLDMINRRRVPRIALSATLGDRSLAGEFLRRGGGDAVVQIRGTDGEQEIKIQQRGYRRCAPVLKADGADLTDEPLDDMLDIARHLFKVLRGSDHLVFANSRRNVEVLADALRRMSEAQKVPNEFFPHHGSLSRDLRQYAEARLKQASTPGTIVATTTLEMGIDIGTVQSVAQIGNPPSVASLRQRLGRSGRAEGGAAVLRTYITEQDDTTDGSNPQDAIRAQTVQSIAMVQLMLDEWIEPPDVEALCLSTLVHQILALVAQHGGVRASEAWTVLCVEGPFGLDSPSEFTELLRAMGATDLITQTGDGLLVLGVRGERIVDHHEFYAVFFSPKEFQVVHEGRALGNLPITKPITKGGHLIFGGRRWEVIDVDSDARVVTVKQSAGGRPPKFDGGPAAVHDEVRQQMREVYCSQSIPAFCDTTSRALLREGRAYFQNARLGERRLVDSDAGCQLFPWVGDKAMNALELLLEGRGVRVTNEGISLNLKCTRADLRAAVEGILADGMPSGAELAGRVENRIVGKYDEFLTPSLLSKSFASERLNLPTAWRALEDLYEDSFGQPIPQPPSS